MRAKRLYILSRDAYVGGDRGKVTRETHDIERMPGEGWMLRLRAGGTLYFVPDGLAIAELEEPATEVTDDDEPAQPAAKAGRGRGRTPEAA